MKKKNEVNACDALIRILERVTGAKYELESCPDEGASKQKEPDFILKSTCAGMAKMAVEHTVTLLFNGQHGYAISSFERAEEINKLCQGKIPEDRYYVITAPYTLINSLKDRRKREDFDKGVADWVTQRAPHLSIDQREQGSYEGHTITLTCGGTHPQWNGKVCRIQERPADVAALQEEAFDKAIQHGLNKFPRYKCNPSENFKTVLLLEDVAGSLYQRVMEGLTPSRKAQIDEYIDYIVVLVSNNDQMIVGNVWKENATWHGFIQGNRRFDLRSEG
jgi:hypothetical protein